jgi:transposase
LQAHAEFELWFSDEVEFHLLPHITRMWMPKGRQFRVPSPGKNQKIPVFGAVQYGTGLFVYHIQDKKNSWGFLALLTKLYERARRRGTKILLVADNASIHEASCVERFLSQPEVREHLSVYLLPTYCPDLNLIERLWGHVKRTGFANELFPSRTAFRAHVIRTMQQLRHKPSSVLGVVQKNQMTCSGAMGQKLIVST